MFYDLQMEVEAAKDDQVSDFFSLPDPATTKVNFFQEATILIIIFTNT